MSSTDIIVLCMYRIEHRLSLAKHQMALLTERIDGAQQRYDAAVADGRLSFRCNGRLKLATLQGVRNMYDQYIWHCMDRLDALQTQLLVMLLGPPVNGRVTFL